MNEMLYEVGELVRVKDSFADLRFNNDPMVDPKMIKEAGKVFVVSKHQNLNYHWYKLEGSNFVWDERWLEPAGTEFKPTTENELLDLLFGE